MIDKWKRLLPILYAGIALGILFSLRWIADGLAARGMLYYRIEALPIVEWGTTLFLLCFTVPAAIVIGIGLQAQKSGEYPPPGTVWRWKRKVLRGDKAVRTGKALVRLGVIAIVLIFISVVINYWLNRSFLKNPFGWVPRSAWEKMEREIHSR